MRLEQFDLVLQRELAMLRKQVASGGGGGGVRSLIFFIFFVLIDLPGDERNGEAQEAEAPHGRSGGGLIARQTRRTRSAQSVAARSQEEKGHPVQGTSVLHAQLMNTHTHTHKRKQQFSFSAKTTFNQISDQPAIFWHNIECLFTRQQKQKPNASFFWFTIEIFVLRRRWRAQTQADWICQTSREA